MGSITLVKKSRKEYKCRKCGKVIPKGSSYYRGCLNFHPDIIRCTSCRLKSYEVTSSDYVKSVGPIVEDWRDSYSLTQEGVEEMISDLEEIRDEQQDHLDNMPEGLQEADTGMLLQDRIDSLESAIDELQNVDIESIISDAIDDLDLIDSDEELLDSYRNKFDEDDYSWIYFANEVEIDSLADVLYGLQESIEASIEESIEDCLSSIDY